MSVAIRIQVDSAVLARSRFAVSPATEVLGTLQHRTSPATTGSREITHHTARWNSRAQALLDPVTLELLHALAPTDHPYAPDFLSPRPLGPGVTIDQVTQEIAATPEEVVDYHLDIGLSGRPVRPEVLEQFPSEAAYLAWRRPAPPALARAIRGGPRAVAEEAALAIAAFFTAAMAQDWPLVCSVLEADIASRGEQISTRGWAAMLEDLGDLTWTGSEMTIKRPYDGVVDWADDGVLFIPCASLSGPVQFSAERPHSPVLTYPARGTAALWTGGRHSAEPVLAGVEGAIGSGRSAILASLDEPRTTRDLSHLDGRSESTISYHLGVLTRAGLVVKRRSGRRVAYRRTALADSLVTADQTTQAGGGRP